MKTLITITSFLIFANSINTAEAKCNTRAIGVYRESGFGISFGGGGSSAGSFDKDVVNVPLTINGQQACFKKVSKFSMKSEKKKDSAEKNSIVINPMKTEFENIPGPHQKQYLFVEKNPTSLLTKFHVMSFICAGETPLSIEATSDSVSKILVNSETADMSVTTVFATGAAAQNLNRARSSKTHSQETFNFFTKLFQDKTKKELSTDKPCCIEYKAPSILTDTSIQSFAGVERAFISSFTTMGGNVPNGCSNEFAETMKNYQLENYESNESLKDYKVKKKWFSDSLVFEW